MLMLIYDGFNKVKFHINIVSIKIFSIVESCGSGQLLNKGNLVKLVFHSDP
jgi:hypothetical protein